MFFCSSLCPLLNMDSSYLTPFCIPDAYLGAWQMLRAPCSWLWVGSLQCGCWNKSGKWTGGGQLIPWLLQRLSTRLPASRTRDSPWPLLSQDHWVAWRCTNPTAPLAPPTPVQMDLSKQIPPDLCESECPILLLRGL